MSQLNGNFYETQAKLDYQNNRNNGVPAARDPFFEAFGNTEHFTNNANQGSPEAQPAGNSGTGLDDLGDLANDPSLETDAKIVAEAASDKINEVERETDIVKAEQIEMEKKLQEQEKTLDKLTQEMVDSDSQRQEDTDDKDAGFFDRLINSFYILMGFDHDKPTYMPVREFGDSMRAIVTLIGLLLAVYTFANIFNIGMSKPGKKEIQVTKLDWDTSKDFGTDAVGYGTKDGLSSSAHMF